MEESVVRHSLSIVTLTHIARSLLVHIFDLIEEAKWEELQTYGIGKDEVRILKEVGPAAVSGIEWKKELLSLVFDPAVMRNELKRIAKRKFEKELHDELIRAGAALGLMRHLYGYYREDDIAKQRTILGVVVEGGRPSTRNPDLLAHSEPLFRQVLAKVGDDPDRLTAQDFLDLHRATGLSAQQVFSILNDPQSLPWLVKRPTTPKLNTLTTGRTISHRSDGVAIQGVAGG